MIPLPARSTLIANTTLFPSTNTLTGNNVASTWAINASNAGTLTDANGANVFTGIQNVTTGANQYAFALSGTGNINGTISGGAGTNTLTLNNVASTCAINAPTAGPLPDPDGANVFTGITNVTGGTYIVDDTATAESYTRSLHGALPGTNTLTGNNVASTWAINAPNAGTLTDANGANVFTGIRSEERRVGKEGRSRWAPDH